MGKRLERFGEVRIVDETNGFGLDFVKKIERLKEIHNMQNVKHHSRLTIVPSTILSIQNLVKKCSAVHHK